MATHLVKGPSESRLYDFEFAATPEIDGGQTIVTATVTAEETTSPALTIGTPTISGSRVQVRISAGKLGQLYELKCVITTSSSNTLETHHNLLVDEVP